MKIELNKVYRSEDGREWKVVFNRDDINSYAIVNKKQDRIIIFIGDGLIPCSIYEDELNLIEFVGDNFTEENKEAIKYTP